MVTYRATLDVPGELVLFITKLLAGWRRSIGIRKGTRALTCHHQAILVLRYFRDRTDPERLGVDNNISRATAYHYIDEATAVLADQAPDLHQALQRAEDEELEHLILDGSVIATDRCSEKTVSAKGKEVDVWYSGEAHHHGGNVQALFAPDGFPLFVSDVEPGSVHDLTAARHHVLGALHAAAARGMPTLADSGYQGAGVGIHTPFKQPSGGQRLVVDNRCHNRLQRALRCLGERGFALLTQRWRVLQHVTASPSKVGALAKAALVLTHFEYGRIQ